MIFESNQTTRQTSIDIAQCSLNHHQHMSLCPLEIFKNEQLDLIRLSSTTISPELQKTQQGLIFLGAISSTENYFRRIISKLISFDPNARTTARNKQIPFGALDWYGAEEIGNTFVDDGSLANEKTIKEIFKSVIGIDISNIQTIDYALGQFSTLCQIRHCIVHANGHIRAINAEKLKIDKQRIGETISISSAFLHNSLQLLSHLIHECNLHTFDKLMARSFKGERAIFCGIYENDKDLFDRFAGLFIPPTHLGPRSHSDIYSIYQQVYLP